MKVVRTRDGSNTLFDEEAGELLRSEHGARQESYHVFLQATGVLQRLTAGVATRVLEVGFGSGLNALLCLDEARAAAAPLEFVSLERRVPPTELLRQLEHAALLRSPALAGAVYEALEDGRLRIDLDGRTRLEVVTGDARDFPFPLAQFHAVFLDAFSPERNPELWTPSFLGQLARALRPGGRLSTYCAKGEVRRALGSHGLSVERLPGPPGKRHMLVATRPLQP